MTQDPAHQGAASGPDDARDAETSPHPGGTEPAGRESTPTEDADQAAEQAPPEEKKRAGCFKVGCLTLLSMIVVIALAVGGLALYVNHQLDQIQHSNSLLPSDGPTRDATAGKAQNILLLGSDSRGKNLRDNGRSDVIQLMHVSSDRRSIQVVHFPRDLYVAIPGHGMNKINAAYSFGGSKLLVSTMQNLLGLHIDHVAQIGFDGFTKLTNAMGGVDVYVRYPYSEGGFGSWTQGYHHMNGEQALGFSRERHQLPHGDIDRGVDQQEWINAMVTKALSRGTLENPKRALDMISAIAPYTLTDTSTSYLITLAVSLRNISRNDLTFYTAPFSGFAKNSVGDVDVVDMPKMKQLGASLRTDSMSSTSVTPNTVS
ncbi:LCP family protein [Allobranchiibius sp. GilTou73]|uniref:LCP family protein n=1 Tax=Allobranchiibius sp. GilTou73 TaxID=2904523 RepID=UPI001F255EE7|nr:LCP family protein [Allobranchiibius sp. GilTou73]UIJ35967.1 LCP family protein [Allobranchiibius sp. GilTou73]